MLAVGVSEGVGGECQPCSGLSTVYVYTNPGPKTEGNFHQKESIILAQFRKKYIYIFVHFTTVGYVLQRYSRT